MAGRSECNSTCGCSIPCPVGVSCRCASVTRGGGETEHSRCSCGNHCGCNPCDCEKAETAGHNVCHCGPGCKCTQCAAVASQVLKELKKAS